MGRLATFPDSMLIFGLRRAEPARHWPASPSPRSQKSKWASSPPETTMPTLFAQRLSRVIGGSVSPPSRVAASLKSPPEATIVAALLAVAGGAGVGGPAIERAGSPTPFPE